MFIAADVFGSNLKDRDDLAQGSPALAAAFAGADLTCLRYTDEQLSLLNLLTLTGFRMHGGYWGAPDEASCFDRLAGAWVPIDVSAAVPRPRAKAGAKRG